MLMAMRSRDVVRPVGADLTGTATPGPTPTSTWQ